MRLALLVAALLLGGCSGYQRAWKEAAVGQSAGQDAKAPQMTGRWSGTWLSHHNGHHGALRCIMRPAGPGQTEAWFDSRYAKILRFKMKTTFETEAIPGGWRIDSEQDLGGILGLYTWHGEVQGDTFHASYRSKHDHGVFDMQRLTP